MAGELRLVWDNGPVTRRSRMCPRCEEERRYWRSREKAHRSKIQSLKAKVAALKRGAPRSPPRPRPSDMPWDIRHLQQQLDFFRNRTVRLTREGADLRSRNEYLTHQADSLNAALAASTRVPVPGPSVMTSPAASAAPPRERCP